VRRRVQTLMLAAAGAAHADQFNNGMAAANARDYATALQIWRPLANEGSADAQAALGVLYDNGFGVVQDHAAAAAWFRKSADQGFAAGEFDLALDYDYGRGVTKSPTLAAFWYRRAADQGTPGAQLALGSLYASGGALPKDPVQAYLWLSLAANRFVPKASEHEAAIKLRQQVAVSMSTEQVAEAERLTDEWQSKPNP
jgi:TPR repeat protein